MKPAPNRVASPFVLGLTGGLLLIAGIGVIVSISSSRGTAAKPSYAPRSEDLRQATTVTASPGGYQARKRPDTAGFQEVCHRLPPWGPDASLEEIAAIWQGVGYRNIEVIDEMLGDPVRTDVEKFNLMMAKTILLNYENEPKRAYQLLEAMRLWLEERPSIAQENLYTMIYFQGITALRRGETDNCVMCRGESSCILPISKSAVHAVPTGSRLAIRHFSEYLERFPEDLEVRWLLNIAHMTLGEHPAKVDPLYLVSLDHYQSNEFDIGRFRDIGQLAGVNRFNMAGGAVME